MLRILPTFIPEFQFFPTSTPRRHWLHTERGDLDEVMAVIDGDSAIITCHGGVAVRRALESALEGIGFERSEAQDPPLFGTQTRLQRQTLALLQQAQGERAVRETLRGLREAEPALRRVMALPAAEIASAVEACAAARFLYAPPRVQLRGVVNSGKSSLLNALCGRKLAATGETPGLTRDVIEGECEHRGVVLRIFDAPGFRADAPEIERQATALAEHWASRADLILELQPVRAAGVSPATTAGSRRKRDRQDVDATYPPGLSSVSLIQIASKIDVEPGGSGVSIKDPQSLQALKDRLVHHFFGPLENVTELLPGLLLPEVRADLTKTAAAAIEVWFR